MSGEKFSHPPATPVENVAGSLSESARSSSMEGLSQLMDRHDRIRIEGLLQLAEIHERTANLQEGFIKEAAEIVERQEGAEFSVGDIFELGRRNRLKRAEKSAAESRERAVKYRGQAAVLQYQLPS